MPLYKEFLESELLDGYVMKGIEDIKYIRVKIRNDNYFNDLLPYLKQLGYEYFSESSSLDMDYPLESVKCHVNKGEVSDFNKKVSVLTMNNLGEVIKTTIQDFGSWTIAGLVPIDSLFDIFEQYDLSRQEGIL